MKKRLFALLSALLCLSFVFGTIASAFTLKPAFEPVLRFVAASDTHLRDDDNVNVERIKKMMNYAYRTAAEDKKHPTVDALLLAGDVTNDGTKTEFDKLKKTLDSSLKENTRLLAIAAKNHDGYHMSRTKERAEISSITGLNADFHLVVGGYHFIGLSVSGKFPAHYDKAQLSWLREQLDDAVLDDPDKPVFVMHHEHVKNTVYGSSSFERWGVPYFNDILKDYPQVVDFSGHSHYPLNHPNSVWQGEFTAVGTGAVKSTDYTVEDMRDIASSPDNKKCSTFWIVEIDRNSRMRLRGIDLLAEKVLCEYILDNPANPENREFSTANKEAISKPPVFAPDAKITAKVQKGTCTVTAPLAKSSDGFAVVLYRAYAKDKNGKTVAETWTQPEYFIADGKKEVKLTLKGLSKGEYTVSAVAETAYGVQSEAIETQISVDSPSAFGAFFVRVGLWFAHIFLVAENAII